MKNFKANAFEPFPFQICGNKSGTLHADRLGSGSKGKCIYCESSDSKWFTPKEFEKFGGRETSKDWKRSVKLDGKPFYFYLKSGDLKIHAFNCYCQICVGTEGGESSEGGPGPIKFFSPPNRKRRAEDELTMPSMVSRYQNSNPSSAGGFDSNSHDMSQLLSLINQSIDKANNIENNHNDKENEDKASSLPTTVTAGADAVPILSENNPNSSIYSPNLHVSVKSALEQISKKASSIEESMSSLGGLLIDMKSDISSLKQLVNQYEKSCKPHSPKSSTDFKNVVTDTITQVITQTEINKSRKREDTVGHCANCNRPAPFKCGRCNLARYCSEFCQQRDWPIHNKTCGAKVHVMATNFDEVNHVSSTSPSENKEVIMLEDVENVEITLDNIIADVTASSDESLASHEMADKANGIVIKEEPSSSSAQFETEEIVEIIENTNEDNR